MNNPPTQFESRFLFLKIIKRRHLMCHSMLPYFSILCLQGLIVFSITCVFVGGYRDTFFAIFQVENNPQLF